jgi:hypothetical protein
MGSAIKLGERARTSVGGLVVVKQEIVTSVLVGFPVIRISAGQCFLPNRIHNIRKPFSDRLIVLLGHKIRPLSRGQKLSIS